MFTVRSVTITILALGCGWLAGAPVQAQSPGPAASVDEVFAGWSRPDGPGCAVGVIRTGSLVYAQGYGSANLEYDIPITPSSVFHVASISKQFTAMAVALLAADGRLSWDHDIRRYVPEVPDFGASVTLRHLANHTSGLRDQWSLLRMAGWRWEEDVVKQMDVLDVLSRQRALNFPPGAEFLYSNTGYTLLAVVVERVSGQSLRAFAEDRIFAPLEMRDTEFHDDHTALVRNRAYAYRRGDDGAYRVSIPDFDVVGPTSLFTTVEDLARWERNFYTGELGGHGVLADLHQRGTLSDGRVVSYGAGLTHGSYRGHLTVGHGGADAGYRSEFLRFPAQELTIAVLCNEPSSNPDRLVRAVADVYLDLAAAAQSTSELRAVEATPVAPVSNGSGAGGVVGREEVVDMPLLADLAQLTGFYRRDDSDTPLQLVVRDGSLTILTGGANGTLLPAGTDRFRLAGSATVGTFDRTDGPAILELSGPVGARYRQEPHWRPAADELARFVGNYYSAEVGAQYSLWVERGRLMLRERRLGTRPLIPTYPGGFFTSGFYLSFTDGPGGSVDGFTISTERAWKVRFDRQ
ncbi:MAG: serine hydrolase domain-containing protein [bacterium]